MARLLILNIDPSPHPKIKTIVQFQRGDVITVVEDGVSLGSDENAPHVVIVEMPGIAKKDIEHLCAPENIQLDQLLKDGSMLIQNETKQLRMWKPKNLTVFLQTKTKHVKKGEELAFVNQHFKQVFSSVLDNAIIDV